MPPIVHPSPALTASVTGHHLPLHIALNPDLKMTVPYDVRDVM